MRVQDVMTRGVETVSPDTAADIAWETMRMNGTHHLAVKEGTQLLGVFSHRDAGGTRGTSLRKGRTVADLMTRGVVSVPLTAPLRKAANLMRGRSIGCLVVTTAGGKPVGIVTVSDLLDVLGRGGDRGATGKRPTLNHRVPHRKQHGAVHAW